MASDDQKRMTKVPVHWQIKEKELTIISYRRFDRAQNPSCHVCKVCGDEK